MKRFLWILASILIIILCIVYYWAVIGVTVWTIIKLAQCIWTGPILILIVFLFWLSQRKK